MTMHEQTITWVPVASSPPPEDGRYLVYAPCGDPDSPLIVVSWWLEGRWHLVGHWGDSVTHWACVPPPPD